MREERTEVLVVGAGPVGLWTAVALAEAGIQVTVLDREQRTAARSYACALHPATLKLLDRVGLAAPLMEQGRRIHSYAFYEGPVRQLELQFPKLGGDYPFVLIVPQNLLERLLEQKLASLGVPVLWNHRFDTLAEESECVFATVQELAGTGTGYIVPHWETVVKDELTIRAECVLGTDGHNSLVRQRLGIDLQRFANAQLFAAFEFESDETADDEVRVVLDKQTTNVLWPLVGNKYRWTFQLLHSGAAGEFPDKERRAVRLAQRTVDERVRVHVEKAARQRAPWFRAPVKEITWCTEVAFEQRMASEFGRNRCWLAGDAAHQTGPVGVQSMNSGFAEGETLAELLKQILRENADWSVLNRYGQEHGTRWHRLLGAERSLQAGAGASAWTREHARQILPCLPGLNHGLERLAAEIHLGFNLA